MNEDADDGEMQSSDEESEEESDLEEDDNDVHYTLRTLATPLRVCEWEK